MGRQLVILIGCGCVYCRYVPGEEELDKECLISTLARLQ